MGGPDILEIQECRGDFWLRLREAIIISGGDPDEIMARYEDRPLNDWVDLLAQNGIRMVFHPAFHVNNVGKK